MPKKTRRRWRAVRRSAAFRRKVRKAKRAWLRGFTTAMPQPEPDVRFDSLRQTSNMLASMLALDGFNPKIRGVVLSQALYGRLKTQLRVANPACNTPPGDNRIDPPFRYLGFEVRVDAALLPDQWFWIDRKGQPVPQWPPV